MKWQQLVCLSATSIQQDRRRVAVLLPQSAQVLRNLIATEVSEMLAAGDIRPLSTLWAAPNILAKNKSGTLRFRVDCQEIKKITAPDCFPVSCIDNVIGTVRRGKLSPLCTYLLAIGKFMLQNRARARRPSKHHPDCIS